MITTLKIRPIDKIVIAFLLTIWIGVWLGYYFFIPGFTYIHTANVLQALIHWDAGWYLDIAQHGYKYNGNDLMQQNIAFFPLYPIIMKFFGQFFGLRNGIATVLPALFIGITSIYAFHALASTILKENASLFATAAYALYPRATFFVSAYPTSIMNLLVILAFLSLNRKKYFMAAIATGISTAAGALLVFLSATMILAYTKEFMVQIKKGMISRIAQLILFAILSIFGIVFFILYQHLAFGNAFAFVEVQKAWGYQSNLQRIINVVVLSPIFGGGYSSFIRSIFFLQPVGKIPQGSVEYFANSFTIIMAIISTVILYKSKQYLLSMYSFLVISAYMWFIGSVQGPSSTVRLLYIDIPIFIAAGLYYQNNEHKITSFTLLSLSAIALIIQVAFFVSGYWVI